MYYVLLYDYVDDIATRRAEHRPAHIALVKEFYDRGQLLMAGAWADPLDGAALLFKAPDRSVVESFVQQDPYVANGLVTSWRAREWTVVVGGDEA